MARQKLVALVVSAVCLAVFAIVTVKGMAARERRSFEASRALLDAGAQLVTSELAVAGRDLPETAERMAVDADLAQQLHVLSGQIATLAAMPKPGERMKTLVLAQTTKVNDRLSTLRGELARGNDVDAVALLDEQGLVLLSDSPVLAVGNRVRIPGATASNAPVVQGAQERSRAIDGVETIGGSKAPEGDAADARPVPEPVEPKAEGRDAEGRSPSADGREPNADGRQPSGDSRVATGPAAPLPTMDDAQTETVRSAVATGPALGALVIDGVVTHIGAAPISFKGKLAGIVVVERRLRMLPKPTGVDPVLALDGQVRMGRPPEGASIDSNAGDNAFLLAPREVRSMVPSFGSVGVGPLFVQPGSVGVWARRFEVARVPGAIGYVYTDVTPAFAELGGLQLMTVGLAAIVFLIHALLIATNGLGLARGVAHISDFMSKQQQGLGDGSRLAERNLPAGLHRLARLVNKSLERGTGATPSIVSARNASLDDVIAHHEPAGAVPDVAELDFGSFAQPASAAPSDASGFKAQTVEMKRPAAATLQAATPPKPVAPTIAAQPAPAAPATPPPAPASAALADPGSAALLASLEELSDSLASSDDGLGDPAIFAPEPARAPARPNGATGTATAAPKSAGPAPKPSATDTPRDVHYREIYQRFVEVRAECAEPVDDLTYDKFTAKLAQSRDAVMAKHTCTDVRFQVYVKNGKAALKATPVK